MPQRPASRRFLVGLALAAALALVAGCGGDGGSSASSTAASPSAGGDLVIAAWVEARTLDPAQAVTPRAEIAPHQRDLRPTVSLSLAGRQVEWSPPWPSRPQPSAERYGGGRSRCATTSPSPTGRR